MDWLGKLFVFSMRFVIGATWLIETIKSRKLSRVLKGVCKKTPLMSGFASPFQNLPLRLHRKRTD
jgi:hypothetical protein